MCYATALTAEVVDPCPRSSQPSQKCLECETAGVRFKYFSSRSDCVDRASGYLFSAASQLTSGNAIDRSIPETTRGYGNTNKLPKAPRPLSVGSVMSAMFPVVGSKTFTLAPAMECTATLIG